MHTTLRITGMYKDILIPLTNTATDDALLSFAIELAEEQEAHLSALVTVALTIPVGFEMVAIPTDVYSPIHDAERANGAQLAQKARDRLKSASISSEVRAVESLMEPSTNVAVLHARYADLSIVVGGADRSGPASGLFADLLMGSGRPVLVIPPKPADGSTRNHVVVAWQPTREATRAVHDALPLLQAAAQVDVIVVDPRVDDGHHGQEPGADIAIHLARHGVRANVVTIPSMGATVEQSILRFAVEAGAGLIVAGGYSHSRLREQVLGGVTRGLFERAGIPVLFSH
ncbi:MAG TPA: universal stress protein [Dokdonella sp.]|nr:universal stress protein [Dokdonella sp.]